MGVMRPDRRPPPDPAKAEYAFLRENWTRYSVAELAKMLGWQPKSVHNRARELGLPGRNPAVTKQVEAARHERQAAVKPLPDASDKGNHVWSDGWSIRPPSDARKMAGR